MLDSQAHETIIQKAMADRANAESMLAREVEKRTDAQASIQAISGLLQDGMANTMNALRHWERDRNAGIQFGNCTPLPLSAQPSGYFPNQDSVRYMYIYVNIRDDVKLARL